MATPSEALFDSWEVSMRISGRKLREARLAAGLTQGELAELAGFQSRDYVGQIERGRQAPGKLETIVAFAIALRVATDDLISVGEEEITSALSGDLPIVAASVRRSSGISIVTERGRAESTTTASLLRRSQERHRAGQCYEAYLDACLAREREGTNLELWGDITLRFCAYYLEEAGKLQETREQIAEVKQRYSEAQQAMPPGIRAQILIQEATIADRYEANFAAAMRLFAEARKLAEETGDQALVDRCIHVQAALRAKQVVKQSGIWLSTSLPRGALLPEGYSAALEQDLTDLLPQVHERDPSSIHPYDLEGSIVAILRPRELERFLDQNSRVFRKYSGHHLLAKQRARMQIGEGEWSHAIREADAALEGFRYRLEPAGIAQSAAIHAYAQRRKGIDISRREAYWDHLDRWALSLMTLPFGSHPLFRLTARELRADLMELDDKQRRRYFGDLDSRVMTRTGVFEAMRGINNPLPSAFPGRWVSRVLAN